MRLHFDKDHLSITPFDDVELPEFSVITGVNGAGKSHLLQAISNKSIKIDDRTEANVVLFDYQNFRLQNEGPITASRMENERKNVWSSFIKEDKKRAKNAINKSKLDDKFYGRLKEIASRAGTPLLSLTLSDIGNQEDFDKLVRYREEIENALIGGGRRNQRTNAVLDLARRITVGIHEIEKNDFVSLVDITNKGSILPAKISNIFSDYYSKLDANRYRIYRKTKYDESLEVFSDTEFVKRHGPKPWDVINEILERFGTLPYRISTPEGLDRDDHFVAELQHQNRPEVKTNFEHLSSGEKILMALVAAVYSSTSFEAWPDVLLLDEVDASLHPSMIQNLLDVIADTFLARGMAVVLVSHSPTTIALAPEEAVFIMNPGGTSRIVKKTKKEALSILTEGFATLDEGVKLFDQISQSALVVLTEGRNVSFIKRLLEQNNVSGVDVIEGLADRSGKAQLKSMYDFLIRVPHDSNVLIVWDPDASDCRSLVEQNNTHPFVLDANTNNSVAQKGIENLFPQHLFSDFKKIITKSRGETTEYFDDERKVDFENFILDRNNAEDFELFDPLLRKIRELAGTSSAS